MKRSIRHLPAKKQNELRKIVQYICKKLPEVEMIILFGSHARGDWVEDIYIEKNITYEYTSDYDILCVMKEEDRIHRVSQNLHHSMPKQLKIKNDINIIFHGIDFLNVAIERQKYFFVDILKEGIRLYHSKKFVLTKPKPLSLENRIEQAKEYFQEYFESANRFYFYSFAEKKFLLESAFLLHQCTERYYITILLVFTGYKPKIHNLEKLDIMCRQHDNRVKIAFPRETEANKKLFQKLKNAYIDARYRMDEYKITKEELEALSENVLELKRLTEIICREHIENLEKQL